MTPSSRLVLALFWSLFCTLFADPTPGPALDVVLSQPQPEPPGPSTRRTGMIISEVLHHPMPRSDELSVQFVELFNSLPWFEDLSGWQIRGSVQFTFPTNTFLPARSYLLVAVSPEDLKLAYNLTTNCFGPFADASRLPKQSGTLQLWNRNGGLCFELNYRETDPWPVATAGAGHSLVLARPTLGERNPEAWAPSAQLGGSPGQAEPVRDNSLNSIRINELRASSQPPDHDFIELYNYSESAVDLSGWALTDDPANSKFVVSTNTLIPARGFLIFDSNQLNFGLSSAGEQVFLRAPDGRVIDALRYPAQEPTLSWGRFPDGAKDFHPLSAPSPSAPNTQPRAPSIVINELMYHPPSDDDADEFLELHNPGLNPMDLTDWRLLDGVKFTFPSNSIIAAGGYAVLGKSADRLRSNYPSLNPAFILGEYQGTLANGGDRVALAKPIESLQTNQNGTVSTSTRYVVVDEVRYGTGGRWGKWSDGGGSSLERRDPRSDSQLAPNWGDSDETKKSPWVTIEQTGRLDNGNGSASPLQVLSFGAGEFLLDNVEVFTTGGTNRVLNPTFETGTNSWVPQGNHGSTTLESTEGDASAQSLHVRATGPGNTGANRLYGRIATALSANQTGTLRARVRWLKGSPTLLLRLHGNWLEAPGYILATKNLGTPGARNTTSVSNSAPAITDVSHFPVLPAPNQSVRVIARINDPDGLSKVTLKYRRDTTAVLSELPMEDNGAGLFSAVIPGQGTGAMVAFHVLAEDRAAQPATASFPDNAPVRECLVRWGESSGNVPLGPYRIWATRDTISKWIRREKLSNDPLDSTFVCGNYRVIYNAGAQYSGSPYHAPSYDSPTGANCDYLAIMPPDNPFLGEFELNLLQPGNGGGDGTCQQEQHAYWIARELGLPYSHRRPVQVFVNGTRRGLVYEDAQQPNSDYVQQWFPNDTDGDLHKIQLWFEFEPDASNFQPIGADLGRYVTTGSVKKLARYRWTFAKRSYGNDPNNYTNLFSLVDVVNTNVTGDRYLRALQHSVDVNNWFRTHITEHIVGNNDSYSYGGGQNMYTYRPTEGHWRLLIWDIDFAFSSQGATSDLFGIGGANVGPRNDVPAFARIYWQGLIDAARGPLSAERSNPIIDSRYTGLRSSGAAVGAATSIKTFVSQRRTYILGLLKSNTAPLKLTTNAGSDFSTDSSIVTITGTAPLEVRDLLINGSPLQLTWTTKTAWSARVVLQPGTNLLNLTGVDFHGVPITNDPVSINIVSSAVPESPVGKVVFNELIHHPQSQSAGFVELKNMSTTTGFDLSNWRMDGLNFSFPPGAYIEPNGFVVVANDEYAFADTYGTSIKLSGVYSGRLSRFGETLRLIRPATPNSPESEVDSLTYRSTPPWPAAANTGSSLQLMDAAQDNNRPGNWTAASTNSAANTWQRIIATGKPTSSSLYLYLQSAGDAYIDDLQLVRGDDPDGGPNLIPGGNFETEFPGPFSVSPNHTASERSTAFHHSGQASLHIVAAEGGSTRSSAIFQDLTPALNPDDNYTLSFWYLAGAGPNTFTTRLSGSGINASVDISPVSNNPNLARYTPGTQNSVATSLPTLPPIWLNEIQAINLNGIVDNTGKREPWVELYNTSANEVSLAGLYLGDNPSQPARWAFPTGATLQPNQYALVWLDAEPAQTTATDWHANFRADPDKGIVLLSYVAEGRTLVLDALHFAPPSGERSIGYLPDGDPNSQRLLGQATPRGPNSLSLPRYPIFINEWMSDNTSTLRDPADRDFEDWFELYNAGSVAIDLTGFLLSDSRTNTLPFEIPQGYSLPAFGRLLVWADAEPGQNSPVQADLHVDFKLSASGESIVLRAPDGTLIDAVDFAAQRPDQSDGRTPDGGPSISEQRTPTPRTLNVGGHPNFRSIRITGEELQIEWNTIPGARYVVERWLSLSTETPPEDVAGIQTATGTTLSVRVPMVESPTLFYRIRQLP